MVPLAHLAAVTLSVCFSAELQAVVVFETYLVGFLGPWPHSCYPYIFEFPDGDVGNDCRFQTAYLWGGNAAESQWAGTPGGGHLDNFWVGMCRPGL